MKNQKPAIRSQKTEVRPPTSGLRPLLIVISAPSGGGKTTLCRQLLAARPDMARAVTCTTRLPRPDEKDGVDYRFLDAAEFQQHIKAGDFLEHAMVFGRSYGTLKSEVLGRLRAGRDVLLNVDVQGAAAIRKLAQTETELKRALVTVFLAPASVTVLEERLKKRGADTPGEIRKRLGVARREIASWQNFDYLLISSTVQRDVGRMLAIVEAEKLRIARTAPPGF